MLYEVITLQPRHQAFAGIARLNAAHQIGKETGVFNSQGQVDGFPVTGNHGLQFGFGTGGQIPGHER